MFNRMTCPEELQAVAEALRMTGGNRAAASKLTGVDRVRLRQLIKYHPCLAPWKNARDGRPPGQSPTPRWLIWPVEPPEESLRGMAFDLVKNLYVHHNGKPYGDQSPSYLPYQFRRQLRAGRKIGVNKPWVV